MVGRQFDRSGRKVFDRGAGLALELGTKEHRTGFGRRFEAETRSEFEKICDPRSEPAEIGEGLCEQSAVFAVSSNSDADDFALSADREQVDGRCFREETFGDHPNAWIEASESMSDGATQAGSVRATFPFEFSHGSGSVRPRRVVGRRPSGHGWRVLADGPGRSVVALRLRDKRADRRRVNRSLQARARAVPG